MKRVLITDVAGMIGSHLLDYLIVKNYEIIGIDNLSFGKIENIRSHLEIDRFKFYRADVGDFETLKIFTRNVDIVRLLVPLYFCTHFDIKQIQIVRMKKEQI
jgi:UDP-glucose 4-epimerase